MSRTRIRTIVAATALVVGGVVAAPVAAVGAPVPENGAPGILSLDASPYPLAGLLAPGERLYWPITATLDAESDGALSVVIRATGELAEDPAGLRIGLRACAAAWTLPADPADPAVCPGGVLADVAAWPGAASDPDRSWSLGAMAARSSRHILVTLSLPSDAPDSLQDAQARIALGFTAAGDTEVVDTGDPLAETGRDAMASVGAGVALLAAGVALAIAAQPVRRARRKRGAR